MKKTKKFFMAVLLSLCCIFSMFAFSGCEFKEIITGQIVKRGGVTYRKDDDHYSIIDCNPSVKSVTIPSRIKNLPVMIFSGVFDECDKLTKIEVEKNHPWLQSINGNLYDKQGELIQYAIGKKDDLFVVPNFVTRIFPSAFEGCDYLKSVIIPDSVTDISSWAFSRCSNLISIVLPNTIAKIDIGTFKDCSNLTTVVIPASVTKIESRAFDACASLKSIEIPDSVTTIGASAFEACTSLKSIVIPTSVTKIENHAFEACNNLTIFCRSTTKPSGWEKYWNFNTSISNKAVYHTAVWGYTD